MSRTDLALVPGGMGEGNAKLVSVTAGIFTELDLPPRECLLEPWLTTQSLSMLTAYRGTGKTWAALGIAWAVATGGSFLKWRAPAARPVLYLDGEMAASDLQGRMRLLMSDAPEGWDERMLQVVTPDLQTMLMPDLSTAHGQMHIDAILHDVKLIIVDNLSALARTGIENDAESWQAIASWALRMRRMGRSVLFIHHAGKSGQQRGTSKREDLLDVSVMLRRPNDAATGAAFVWDWSKARGLHGNDAEPIRAELATVGGKLEWTWRPGPRQRGRDIVALKGEGKSVRRIAEALGIPKSTVHRELAKAKVAEDPDACPLDLGGHWSAPDVPVSHP